MVLGINKKPTFAGSRAVVVGVVIAVVISSHIQAMNPH